MTVSAFKKVKKEIYDHESVCLESTNVARIEVIEIGAEEMTGYDVAITQ